VRKTLAASLIEIPMVIQTENYQLKKGAFADVFIDINAKTAIKLFKSYDHPDLDGTGKESIGKEQTNDYRKKVFETENQAYICIQGSKLLGMFTPTYYGVRTIKMVHNCDTDISNYYLLDCCYLIEYIVGRDEKLNILRQNKILIKSLEINISFQLQAILDEFEKCGIEYILDSQVIFNDSEFKIIDFATKDPNEFEPIIEL
jgi:hypothetical protein